jgi:thiamine-phosphate pyrophosphorylase
MPARNWRKEGDWRLCLVTDRSLCLGRSLEEVALAAVRGGAGMVQLREKTADTREFLELARLLARELHPRGVPLIINDRADIALAAGAAGLHVGQSDLPVRDARELLGAGAVIGLSLERREEWAEARELDVDYVAASPVFPTPTKKDTMPAWGMDGLAWLKERSPVPVVAIGGINAGNAAGVVAAGADILAVVSALCSAPDPERAARELLAAFPGGKS